MSDTEPDENDVAGLFWTMILWPLLATTALTLWPQAVTDFLIATPAPVLAGGMILSYGVLGAVIAEGLRTIEERATADHDDDLTTPPWEREGQEEQS